MHACRKVCLSSSTILVLKQDHDGIGAVEVCGCNFVEKATIFECVPRGAIDRSGASKIRTCPEIRLAQRKKRLVAC